MDHRDMELISSDKEQKDQASEEKGQVLFKEWMQQPIVKVKRAQCSWRDFLIINYPELSLFAARPPAVKQWESFRSKAETCFERFLWPCLSVPSNMNSCDSDGDLLSTFQTLNKSLFLSLVCLGKSQLSLRIHDGHLIRQSNNHDLIAFIIHQVEEACEIDIADLKKYNSANNKNHTQRLVEDLYGRLVSAGVLYGAYLTRESSTFIHIDPNDGSLVISPSFRHDAKDFTAKQGMFYLATLAIKQPNVNILANIGPRKPLAALDNNFSKLFRGLNNMQVISVEDIRLGKLLGTGNAARVYEAYMDGVPVAIKVAHVDGRFDNDYRSMPCADRLVIEIKTYEALKAFQGNTIPRVVAYGLIENRAGDFLPFLAMERINGKTLDDAMNGMSEEAVPGTIIAVKSAYRKLHAAGYNQGSVKPLNVMLTEQGRAVIIDFGRGEKRCDCEFERRQVRDMLESLVKKKLKLGSLCETREKLEQWEDEWTNAEETPSLDEAVSSTKTNKFAGRPCAKSEDAVEFAKSLAIAVKWALMDVSFKQLCWSEGGGNKLPVVVPARGKKRLQWTATGKQLVSMIKKNCGILMEDRTRRRMVVTDALLRSQLQSKLCKRG